MTFFDLADGGGAEMGGVRTGGCVSGVITRGRVDAAL